MMEPLHAAKETRMFSLPLELLVEVVENSESLVIFFLRKSAVYSGSTSLTVASTVPAILPFLMKVDSALRLVVSSSVLPLDSAEMVNIDSASGSKPVTLASLASCLTSAAILVIRSLQVESSTVILIS